MSDDGVIAIACPGGFSAGINPLGAELWRLRDGDGNDLLWDGDPAFWTGRAPVLFPIIGELAHGRYRWQGREWALPRHGFARKMAWRVGARTDASVSLQLRADAATLAVYPFDFVLSLTFAVARWALRVEARVENAGRGEMPFSLGFHPALRWPFVPGLARGAHRLEFDRPEPKPVARLNADGLIAREEASPVAGRVLPLDDALFRNDALVFAGLASRGVSFGVPGQKQVRCTFPAFPDLGIWTKPGAGYLCIEPWQGHADPVGFDGDLAAKPGVVIMAPGGAWQGEMTLSLEEQPL